MTELGEIVLWCFVGATIGIALVDPRLTEFRGAVRYRAGKEGGKAQKYISKKIRGK